MINKDFNSILELIKTFPDEDTCIDHLEQLRWNGKPVSPFDAESKVYKCAGGKYKCKNTGKYFNVRTNTIFDNTKLPLQKWFLGIWLVTSHKKGISSMQLAKDLDITQKSAWFMLQRIRNCFGIDNDGDLDGEVEADETYVGGKNKNRHADKKVANSQGRSTKDKTPVFGVIQREGRLIAKQVENTGTSVITREIAMYVKQTALLFTDEWTGYNAIKKTYDHSIIKHNCGEYVRGRVHTNTLEGFWSLLKRGIMGIYHSTSKKHLQKYVDEFVFCYNSRHQDEGERFNNMLRLMSNKLTYNQLINATI